MTLTGVESQIQFQPSPSLVSSRKPASAIQGSDEERGSSRSQQDRGGLSPIQDQVTLSKEAQALASSNKQDPKNGGSQEASSPFDR